MSDTITLKLAQRGIVTLPKSLRETYNLQPGTLMQLIDLGGVFVISPQQTEIDALADRITEALIAGGETLESMLQALREEREQYAA